MKADVLSYKLSKVKATLDVKEILGIQPTQEYIQKYYSVNKIPYTLFHSSSGLVHLGLTHGSKYSSEDLLGMTRVVANYVSDVQANNVLELATGRGGNSAYLAKQFSSTNFIGIDISDDQLSFAHKEARKVNNYSPRFGDYHDLSQFSDGSLDLVFVIEALCYSQNKERVFSEVRRVLKKGGLFTVFDGYAKKEKAVRTAEEQLACSLVERGMALPELENYMDFKNKAETYFSVVKEEDVSTLVIPTMRRFERLARTFFKVPSLARLLNRVLPSAFINNAAVGYLWPTTMEKGLYCYMLTVLQK